MQHIKKMSVFNSDREGFLSSGGSQGRGRHRQMLRPPAPQAVVAPQEINQPISWFERGRGALKVQIKINNMGDYVWDKLDGEIVEAQGRGRYTEIRYFYRQTDRIKPPLTKRLTSIQEGIEEGYTHQTSMYQLFRVKRKDRFFHDRGSHTICNKK